MVCPLRHSPTRTVLVIKPYRGTSPSPHRPNNLISLLGASTYIRPPSSHPRPEATT